MDGTEPKIEIFKPFGEAFELMKRILFQPFDFKKWLVIGFAAFLCGHYSAGGFGFNFPSPGGNFGVNRAERNFAAPDFGQWQPWLPVLIGVFALLFLVLVLVLMWLRARGNFIFLDGIVRNRAAIAEPWCEYRKEGNSYFWFSIAVVFTAMVLVGALMLVIFVPLAWANPQPHGANAAAFIIIGIIVFLVWISFAIAFTVISFFMVPVMYLRRCRALDAFREVARLVLRNLGSFVLFILFSIVLFLALIVASTVVTCATCCIAALPYVGTVVMLPAFVWLRAFGLLFFRQFGPDYDVWAVGTPVETVLAPPLPPPIQS